MQQPWQTITEPGAIDDLVADAHAAGYPDVNVRLIHSWIAKGPLDHPQLRTLARGSDKAVHGVNQRRLLLILLDKRREVPRLSSLAQVPLALWLWWGDAYVPTRQAQQAFVTWLGRGQRSKDVAREGALGLLRQVNHPLATPTSRTRFVRLVTELGNGTRLTPRGRAELLDAVGAVMEPDSVFGASGLVRALGPAQAAMTAEVVVAHAEAMNIAVQRTLAGRSDAVVLEQARALHRTSTAEYLAQRRALAAQAGPLADAFREPTLDDRLACSITAKAYSRVPDRVTVSKKSQASKASAWERRKLAQLVEARSGAGSIPASFRMNRPGFDRDLRLWL